MTWATEIDYTEGTLLWYWFEDWVLVVCFVLALVVALWAAGRSGWSGGGLLLKALMVAAVLAGLPLTLIRLAVDIDVSETRL